MFHDDTICDITEYLSISGVNPVRAARVKDRGITSIVNATQDLPSIYVDGIDYLKVRVDDSPYVQICAYFDLVGERIRQTRDIGGKTLVHCVAGISRSASLCIAYLLKHERYTLREAYYKVKRARGIIRPNVGFFRQLIEYERKLRGRATVAMVPARYGTDDVPDVYIDEVKPATHNHHRSSSSSSTANHVTNHVTSSISPSSRSYFSRPLSLSYNSTPLTVSMLAGRRTLPSRRIGIKSTGSSSSFGDDLFETRTLPLRKSLAARKLM